MNGEDILMKLKMKVKRDTGDIGKVSGSKVKISRRLP